MILALDTQQLILIISIGSLVFLLILVAFCTWVAKKKKRTSVSQEQTNKPIQKDTTIDETKKEDNVEIPTETRENNDEPAVPTHQEEIFETSLESKEDSNEKMNTSQQEKLVPPVAEEPVSESDANERVVTVSPFFQSKVADPNATVFIVMYNKSMKAKISMGTPECRQYYQELKSYLLSYGLKSRLSWSYDSIYLGRIPFAKLSIRGKTLSMNIALDPTGYEGGMYEDCHELKKYVDVPLRIKIKSNRSLKLAKQAIDLLASTRGYAIKEEISNCEIEPIRSLKENLQLGLVKKLKMKQAVSLSSISADDLEDLEISVDAAETVKQVIVTKKCSGKKEIINLDTISKNYKENEIVSLATLVEKHLVSPKAKAVKCLARGILDKPLHFELNDYSNDAVKMILVTGGTIE